MAPCPRVEAFEAKRGLLVKDRIREISWRRVRRDKREVYPRTLTTGLKVENKVYSQPWLVRMEKTRRFYSL